MLPSREIRGEVGLNTGEKLVRRWRDLDILNVLVIYRQLSFCTTFTIIVTRPILCQFSRTVVLLRMISRLQKARLTSPVGLKYRRMERTA